MESATPRPVASDQSPPVGEPGSRYLWGLLGMLMSATIFEGYDITIFHLCTPDIALSFQLGNAAIGAIATIVRIGGIASFFVVTLADRYGRKPIIANTVLCYALFTLMTALSSGVYSFTAFQSLSQVFLAAEFGLAITIICEEFPDRLRGRAISILHMVAFVGVAVAGILYGYMAKSSWGWRGMYFLGIAPLIVVAWLRRGMRETRRFDATEGVRVGDKAVRESVLQPLRRCLGDGAAAYRRRMLLIATLCNCIGVVGGPTISFFSLYAQRDHHWTSSQVGTAIVVAYLLGSAGTLIAGWLLDQIGRRMTTAWFFVGAAASVFVLFRSDSDQAILFGIIATMFTYQGARTAMAALSSELFPTSARATGFNLTVQVFGQIGWTIAPLLAGLLADLVGGLGPAVSLFAAGPLVGAVLVAVYVPETRGKTLEQLSPEAALIVESVTSVVISESIRE